MLSQRSLQNEQLEMVMAWESFGVRSHRSSFDTLAFYNPYEEMCGRSGLCVCFFLILCGYQQPAVSSVPLPSLLLVLTNDAI